VLLWHKFAKQSRVGIFRNERTRSIPLDTKLMFWGVSDLFGTARKLIQNLPYWCHFRTSSLNKVALEFSEMNAHDPLHWTRNSCFVAFRTVSLLHEKQNWPNWCHHRTSSLNNVASEFFATNAPDPLIWTQNSCFGAFRTVSLRYESRCKPGRTGAIIAQVR
jgi:hypothetical protein